MPNNQKSISEEEERLIHKIANKISEYGMNVPAILVLQSAKPLAYIGGELGVFFISPFLPVIGNKYSQYFEKAIDIFEKEDNIEKLIVILEQKAVEEESNRIKERDEKTNQKKVDKNKKLGWKRFVPFI